MSLDEEFSAASTTSVEAEDFSIQEWHHIRNQIHLLLSTIWRFEIAAISGYAIFFSWFLGSAAHRIGGYSILVLITSTAFAHLIKKRLSIEYGILIRLGEYSEMIEKNQYGTHAKQTLSGFEYFHRLNPPDKLTDKQIFSKYTNAGNIFKVIILINYAAVILYALYNFSYIINCITFMQHSFQSVV